MISFGQSSRELTTAFINRLYKINKYRQIMDQSHLDQLQKAMNRCLDNPQKLFSKIIALSCSQAKVKSDNSLETSLLIEHTEQQQDFIDEVDDLQCYQPDNNISSMIDSKQVKPLQVIAEQDQFSKSNDMAKIGSHLNEVDSCSSIDEQYQEECRLTKEIQQIVKDKCNIYLSGTYTEQSKKFNHKNSTNKLQSNILMLKHANIREQYVFVNTKCTLKTGDHQNLLHLLKLDKQMAQ